MIPGVIEGWNVRFDPPRGATKEECRPLHVRVEEVQYTNGIAMHHVSAWFPTPDELKRLNEGAPVNLTIVSASGQPPVALTVGENPL